MHLANFAESPEGEVRRILIPRTPVNERKGKGRGCLEPRSSTTPFLALLHAEGFRYLRGEIGVVVHYLPSVRFATVDVRHTPINAYRRVSNLRLAMFGAQGVRCIARYGNHYQVIQRHLPIRECLCGLLPASSHLFPSERSATKGVHGAHVRAVRPDLLHRPAITIECAV